jgi:hypothetical protein
MSSDQLGTFVNAALGLLCTYSVLFIGRSYKQLKKQAQVAADMANEAALRANEASLRAEVLKAEIDRIQNNHQRADSVVAQAKANAALDSAARAKAREEIFQGIALVAAIITAMEQIDDEEKFQLLVTKFRTFPNAPLLTSEDQKDIKPLLRILAILIHTINEPDWIELFRQRLTEQRNNRLLLFSEEGRADLERLINFLRPGIDECLPEHTEFVKILDDVVLTANSAV